MFCCRVPPHIAATNLRCVMTPASKELLEGFGFVPKSQMIEGNLVRSSLEKNFPNGCKIVVRPNDGTIIYILRVGETFENCSKLAFQASEQMTEEAMLWPVIYGVNQMVSGFATPDKN